MDVKSKEQHNLKPSYESIKCFQEFPNHPYLPKKFDFEIKKYLNLNEFKDFKNPLNMDYENIILNLRKKTEKNFKC